MKTGTVTVVDTKSTGNLSWVPEEDAQSEHCGGLLASSQPQLPPFLPSWVFVEAHSNLTPFSKSPQICPIITREIKKLLVENIHNSTGKLVKLQKNEVDAATAIIPFKWLQRLNF